MPALQIKAILTLLNNKYTWSILAVLVLFSYHVIKVNSLESKLSECESNYAKCSLNLKNVVGVNKANDIVVEDLKKDIKKLKESYEIQNNEKDKEMQKLRNIIKNTGNNEYPAIKEFNATVEIMEVKEDDETYKILRTFGE